MTFCTCNAPDNRHAGLCLLSLRWLESFGISDGRDPTTGRVYETIDLTDTRYGRVVATRSSGVGTVRVRAKV